MAFTEFYCQSGGSNLNAGSTTNNTAAYTCVNSNWNGTSIFTPTDGSTPANTVSVGDWASVYLDAAATAVYIARVTTVAGGVNGAITLSTTAKAGSAPTSSATGRSIKVGGAWKGPNAADGVPLTLATLGSLTNSGGDYVRINLKNDATYSITANIACTSTQTLFQGYTSTPGDGGMAIIDGGTSGTSYTLLTASGVAQTWSDFIFQNNGATATATGVTFSGLRSMIRRCVVHDIRGRGASFSGGAMWAIECEIYSINTSGSSGFGAFDVSGSGSLLRCIAHDNPSTNTVGFAIGSNAAVINCIADTNSGAGLMFLTAGTEILISGCDFYNNGAAGININSTTQIVYIENCNLIKNTTFGIVGSSQQGFIINCGYGSGTQANGSGDASNIDYFIESGKVTYASNVTPWVDPANGDFRVTLAAAKNDGRGAFTQTQGSYGSASVVGYPDIGAIQHLSAPGQSSNVFGQF